ncbi:hypothetical protein ACHAWU_003723 [Discostella pseudostelligera]|uniref:Plastid lipid-associated protein/fibrillin conserved domain-containing protein n=1 Tax=Discostella pseudostelligera TaxID=259834 RepID=A0ABD3N873_9STRA
MKILDAKESFKRLLIQHKGGATHPEVNAALEQLVQIAAKDREGVDNIAQEWSPARSLDANKGVWRSITTPPFPGKLPDDSDGKIDESDEVTIGSWDSAVDQPEWKQTYTIQVMMEIETPSGKLPAKLTNLGRCFPKSAAQLGVIFSSGILEPSFELSKNSALAALWKETFDDGIAKEQEAESFVSRIKSMITYKVLDGMMGLKPPSYDCVNFTQTYKIGRPYAGHLDILYLDEELRVTRGNKGTIVVAERVVG